MMKKKDSLVEIGGCGNSLFKKIGARGFTLIELLACMMIIGLMLTWAIPNIANIQQKTKEQSVKHVARGLQLGLEAYYLQYQYYPKTALTVTALCNALIGASALKEVPKNPFTGQAYTDVDASGKILYAPTSQGYALTLYGDANTVVIGVVE